MCQHSCYIYTINHSEEYTGIMHKNPNNSNNKIINTKIEKYTSFSTNIFEISNILSSKIKFLDKNGDFSCLCQ